MDDALLAGVFASASSSRSLFTALDTSVLTDFLKIKNTRYLTILERRFFD
jgi:hypothetical protein